MNQQLSPTQLAEITKITTMSRREKLFRLARLIRECKHPLTMFTNLEYVAPAELLAMKHPASAFALAAQDPILKDAGLQGNTIGEALQFFDMTCDELHAFSCDCGGYIDNERMARRVENIANLSR
jgi:hypothetical protein